MKRNMRMAITGMVAFGLLAACNGDSEPDATTDANDDAAGEGSNEGPEESSVEQTITYATSSDPVGLSPTETWDTISDKPIDQMYERLVDRDPETGDIVPHLATSFDSVDDLTWVFELQEGVEFHDGTPFNAEAVKYTFEKLIDPETAAPGAHIMSFLDTVEVIDDYTIELTTHEPSPNVLPVLANRTAAIISPEADQNQNLMQEPVGTGPFEFESWTQGDRLVMTKNENYWGEPAMLDEIVFLTVPDQSTALSMLETGEVDFVDGIESEQMSRIEAMSEVELLQTEGTAVYFLSFNTEKEPMDDPEFRRAVAMAVDVDSYLTQLGDTAFKSRGIFGPAVLDYDESIEDFGYDYDPDAAREIIEENGFGDQPLTIYTADRDAYERMANIAQAQLSEVGLDVSISQMEWGTLLDATADGEQDMFTLGSSNSMTGLETLYGYFHSDSVGANNRTQYANEEYDQIVDEARRTLDDDERQALINEVHEYVLDEALAVSMHHSVNTIAHHESVQDIILPPELVFSLREAYKE